MFLALTRAPKSGSGARSPASADRQVVLASSRHWVPKSQAAGLLTVMGWGVAKGYLSSRAAWVLGAKIGPARWGG